MQQMQAQDAPTAYGHLTVPESESMVYWLAKAAKALREEKGRLQVHIGASASRDQSTIWRFEAGTTWPRDPDRIVEAYADDLHVSQAAIWQRAVELWIADDRREQTGRELAEHAQQVRPPSGADGKGNRAPRRTDQQS
jgi:hypothetical protein